LGQRMLIWSQKLHFVFGLGSLEDT
jgi:hypothetical protein